MRVRVRASISISLPLDFEVAGGKDGLEIQKFLELLCEAAFRDSQRRLTDCVSEKDVSLHYVRHIEIDGKVFETWDDGGCSICGQPVVRYPADHPRAGYTPLVGVGPPTHNACRPLAMVLSDQERAEVVAALAEDRHTCGKGFNLLRNEEKLRLLIARYEATINSMVQAVTETATCWCGRVKPCVAHDCLDCGEQRPCARHEGVGHGAG